MAAEHADPIDHAYFISVLNFPCSMATKLAAVMTSKKLVPCTRATKSEFPPITIPTAAKTAFTTTIHLRTRLSFDLSGFKI
jgi:hypothetical protein